MKENKGITLLALIITIIVLLILAGVSLNALTGDNGILSNAQLASVKTKFASYKEELGMSALDNNEINAVRDQMKKYVKNLDSKDINKFVIIKSKLIYIGSDELETQAAQSMGMGVRGNASAVREIQAIVGSEAMNLGKTYALPSSDSVETAELTNTADGLIGTRLYDRNSTSILNGKWNIVDEYNYENIKTARYGSGCYLLEKGKTYQLGDEDPITFENNYIMDYQNNDFILLSDRAVNWNKDTVLAVGGPVLNLDPMAFEGGKWINLATGNTYEEELAIAITDEEKAIVNATFYNFHTQRIENENGVNVEYWDDTKIQKIGDVVYNTQTESIEFNKDELNNASGEGGYLKISETQENRTIDFSKGFSFEMYGYLSRMFYTKNGFEAFGLFCRASSLSSDLGSMIRFGGCVYAGSTTIADLCNRGEYTFENGNMLITSNGNINLKGKKEEALGFKPNTNFYMTFVYISGSNSELCDDFMKNNPGVDRIEYYLNGELIEYTYHYASDYQAGLNKWNSSPCFIGICPWYNYSSLFYIKGDVYTTRLYDKPLTETQVKANYDMTLKYRSSF